MLPISQKISIQSTLPETEMEPASSGQYYQHQMPDSTELQEVAQNGRRRSFDQTLVAGMYGFMAGTGIAASTSPLADNLAIGAGVTVSFLSLLGLVATTYRTRNQDDSGYKLWIKNLMVAGLVGLLGYSANVHKEC